MATSIQDNRSHQCTGYFGHGPIHNALNLSIPPPPALDKGTTAAISNSISSYETIVHDIELNSDYEKLIQGCFENYLTVHFKDPSLAKVGFLRWDSFD